MINILIPAYAREIPLIGSAFGYIQDQINYKGLLSFYSANYNQAAIDNGISVTVSEIYCDGDNLFISYIVEGEELADLYKSENYFESQMLLETDYTVDVNTKAIEFDKSGIEGKWINDGTAFAGVDIIEIQGEDSALEFPEKFVLNIDISSIGLLGNNSQVSDEYIKGKWIFNLNVECNYSDICEYVISESKNDHSIDKVVVSPVMITLYTSYPDIYYSREFWNYDVVIYSDLSQDEPIANAGNYYHTNGITKIPRYLVENEFDIYIIDSSTMTDEDKPYEKSTFESHAIVSAHIVL